MFWLIVVALTLISCKAPVQQTAGMGAIPAAKITFDLGRLDPDGLAGPADGKRALSYEFCIPATKECEAQVRGIDPTVQIQRGARGRIGCSRDQWLCIGSTHQPEFSNVLHRLAALDYVARIDECFFE